MSQNKAPFKPLAACVTCSVAVAPRKNRKTGAWWTPRICDQCHASAPRGVLQFLRGEITEDQLRYLHIEAGALLSGNLFEEFMRHPELLSPDNLNALTRWQESGGIIEIRDANDIVEVLVYRTLREQKRRGTTQNVAPQTKPAANASRPQGPKSETTGKPDGEKTAETKEVGAVGEEGQGHGPVSTPEGKRETKNAGKKRRGPKKADNANPAEVRAHTAGVKVTLAKTPEDGERMDGSDVVGAAASDKPAANQ